MHEVAYLCIKSIYDGKYSSRHIICLIKYFYILWFENKIPKDRQWLFGNISIATMSIINLTISAGFELTACIYAYLIYE